MFKSKNVNESMISDKVFYFNLHVDELYLFFNFENEYAGDGIG